jgi:group I intron endonuclease
MHLIYCHTNKLNDMRYVGYTSQTMMKRWAGHVCDALKHNHMNTFAKAIREHGPDVWEHEVICDGIVSVKEAKLLERHYIEMLNTCGPLGYNMTRGGNGSGPKNAETRALIKQKTREGMAKVDPSWKDRQREAMKDPNVRQTISERTTTAMNEPELRAKMLEITSGEAFRTLVSERTTEAMQQPKIREKQLEAIRSSEVREKMSVIQSDPAYVKKQSEAHKQLFKDDPDYRQKVKDRTREAMQRPEVKAKMKARKLRGPNKHGPNKRRAVSDQIS